MENRIKQIEIDIAVIKTNTKYIVDNLPKCEKEVIKEKLKLFKYLITTIFGAIISLIFIVLKDKIF